MLYFYRSYNHPQPEIARIDESCLSFHTGVLQGLKLSGVDTRIYVPFLLDVWRCLTKDRGRAANEWGGGHIFLKKMILIGLPVCQIIAITI